MSTTKILLLLLAGDIHPNPGHTAKCPGPVCARDVTSRGVSYRCTRCSGWVHAKCFGLLNAAHYRRNKDWTCAPLLGLKDPAINPHHHLQPLLYLPNKLDDDSTFYSSNANGIGPQTDRTSCSIGEKQDQSGGYTGVKALDKILNPCIRNYTTVHSPWPRRRF